MELKLIDDPQDIPAYLKQQKRVKMQAVHCKIEIRDRYIRTQPMIL